MARAPIDTGIRIQAEAGQAIAEFDRGGQAVDRLGEAAAAASAKTTALGQGLDRATGSVREIGTAAGTASAAVTRLGDIIDRNLGVRTDFGGAGRAADIADYGRQLDALRAKFNPLFAAQRQYLETLREIRSAERVGALSQTETQAAIARTKAAFADQVRGMQAVGGQMRLTSQQAANLSFQLNDVAVSLAGGMNPLMVLMQQGSQVTSIFGGVRGTLAAVAGVLTPVRLGLGGVAAVAVSGAAAWLSYRSSATAVEVAVTGLGRSVGTTADRIEGIARASGAAGAASVRDARAMAVAFLSTGRIGAEFYDRLIGLSKDFGTTLGISSQEAGEKLAQIFADPGKGAETLFRQYNLIDGSTARYIGKLAEAGRTNQAQTAILDALNGRLASHDQALNRVQRAWEAAKRSASDGVDAFGRGVDRLFGAEPGMAEVIRNRDRFASRRDPYSQAAAGFTSQQIAEMREIERQRARLDATRYGRTAEAGVETALGSPANAEIQRIEQLRAAQEKLRAAMTVPSLQGEDRSRVATALDATTRAIETYIPAAEKQRRLDEMDIRIQQERSPAIRARLAEERELLSLSGQTVTGQEAAARAEGARNRVMADAATKLREMATGQSDRLDELRLEIQLVGQSAEARRRALAVLEAEQRIRREGIDPASGTAADIRRRADQAAALEAQLSRSQTVDQTLRGGAERLQVLQAEIQLVGQSEAVRARYLATLEAEQAIRRAGIATMSDEAVRMREQAAAIAAQTTSLSRLQAGWSELSGFGGRQIDSFADALVAEGDAMENLRNAGVQALRDLTREMLTFTVANPLKNLIFGSNLPTAADAGGLTSRLFGGGAPPANPAALLPASTGQMTVNAASVIVNGGVGGAGATAASAAAGAVPSTAGSIPIERGRVFATGYSPQLGGDRIEGGYESSIRGPDGAAMVRTLDDYRAGRSDYVTLAGNPAFYGQRYNMPSVDYTSGGQKYSLSNVPGVVHDTGSAFRTAPEGRFDIALGRDLNMAERNQSMASVEFQKLATTTQTANTAMTQSATQLTALQTSAQSATSGLGDFGSGITSLLSRLFSSTPMPAIPAPVLHTGGMVGAAAATRRLPASTWATAPRAHSGAMVAGERAIIAQEGEGIFTPHQMANADRLIRTQQETIRAVMARPAGDGGIRVNVANYSDAQVATSTRRQADGSRVLDMRIEKVQAETAAFYGLRPNLVRD